MPAMTTSDIVFLRKLAEIKRSGQFKISMEQLRRLEHIKQGQFTATITEEEEPMPPKFLTDIQDAEVKNPIAPFEVRWSAEIFDTFDRLYIWRLRIILYNIHILHIFDTEI